MATNEQQRRAIGANNEAARRSIGSGNEAARRNIGRSNIAERTGLVDDLNRLVSSGTATKTLRTIEPRGARPSAVGVSTYTAPAAGSGGGGIASPLTEKLTPTGGSTRTYYAATSNLYSSDYLLAVEIEPLKNITMIDATGAEVVFNFASPPNVGG